MVNWIDEYKGEGPWTFTPQSDKWGYLNNPRFMDPGGVAVNYTGGESAEPQVWSTEQNKGSQGSAAGHVPCGHWHKVPANANSSRRQLRYIGYTSQQMEVSEQQTFTLLDADGNVLTLPADCEWQVTAGGGYISPSGVYTAPATNPSCSLNPTISLVCGGTVIDSVNLAVNADISNSYAFSYVVDNPAEYYCSTCPGSCACHPWVQMLDCRGVEISSDYKSYVCSGCTSCDECITNARSFWVIPPAGYNDMRTAPMIAGGCCPAALL